MREAAGILLLEPSGKALFVRRSDSGLWATPAGHLESGETYWEAAKREIFEETSYPGPFKNPKEIQHLQTPERSFWLFSAQVPRDFSPRLDAEHTDFQWRALSDPPKPLHWGLRWLQKS